MTISDLNCDSSALSTDDVGFEELLVRETRCQLLVTSSAYAWQLELPSLSRSPATHSFGVALCCIVADFHVERLLC
jgi:hypothetical protein